MNRSKYKTSSAASLSETERRVVTLLAKGLSNRAIARATSRSEATVKFHLKNVYQKLGVNSRMQVLLWAMSTGGDRVPSPVTADERAAVL